MGIFTEIDMKEYDLFFATFEKWFEPLVYPEYTGLPDEEYIFPYRKGNGYGLGNGDGYGSGNGNGDGLGDGNGYGDGFGLGNGDGDGFGDGNDNGDGIGYDGTPILK